ncbi:hypothetical protein [Alteribacter keqinensis]|uniref:DUF4352 domain-containing protein n=1 Tax=Alteribacter keqinensis TaxID=2483800 RepID=A0A3M7TQ20_9BACI|nr:hypothetical protein [Alteribacter keqinensis]RNA67107.1 hypothetical protein EBO34_18130 [Alteribacter keqinensis]
MKNTLTLFFFLLMIGCTGSETSEIAWGETADQSSVHVTPLTFRNGSYDNQIEKFEVIEFGQVAIIEFEAANRSETPVIIDRDFYYGRFAILMDDEITGREHLARMDLDLFPFDVFTGELQPDEKVETSLFIYTGPGEIMNLLYDGEKAEENDYAVNWSIPKP